MSYDDWKLATPPEYDGCPDGCGNDCCIPPYDEDDEPDSAGELPEGWDDAVRTWMRIWEGSNRELERKPDSCRAQLVNATSYRHLRGLMAQRPCEETT